MKEQRPGWLSRRFQNKNAQQDMPQQPMAAPASPALSLMEECRQQLLSALAFTQQEAYQALSSRKKDEARQRVALAQKALGEEILRQEKLFVLSACLAGSKPVYIGLDGRMEVFTHPEWAQGARDVLSAQLLVETEVTMLSGAEAVRRFFHACAHDGIEWLRLDNGAAMCEVPLKAFSPYRTQDVLSEKNCALRGYLHRARLYAMLSARQPAGYGYQQQLRQSSADMAQAGYREMGGTLLYALGLNMMGDRVYASREAQEKLRLLAGAENGVSDSGINEHTALQLCFVNRPGEVGAVDKGLVCAFTDLKQARYAREWFARSGTKTGVTVVSMQELLHHASQCAGLVVDMPSISYEIPKADFGYIASAAAGDMESEPGSTLPVLRATEMKGDWRQFDYQWPYRYDYSYMLRMVQWLLDQGFTPQTLVTGGVVGAETEHIKALKAKGYRVEELIGVEQGMIGLGGFCKGAPGPVKICWYNQSDLLRIYVSGNAMEESVNAFVRMIFEEEL